jgi:uncharacterized membrane protein YagU involved in acid resistance
MRWREEVGARDLALGALGGVLGTLVMAPVGRFLYRRQDEESRRREKALRRELPQETLAGRLVETAGTRPTRPRKRRLGAVVHWSYGIAWGMAYAVARRRWPVLSYAFGLPFGVGFFLVGDELMNAVMGLTAPPKAYPLAAHARGLVSHVAYAAAADLTCRAGERVAR